MVNVPLVKSNVKSEVIGSRPINCVYIYNFSFLFYDGCVCNLRMKKITDKIYTKTKLKEHMQI